MMGGTAAFILDPPPRGPFFVVADFLEGVLAVEAASTFEALLRFLVVCIVCRSS